MEGFDEYLAVELARLNGAHFFRRRRAVRVLDAVHVEIDGRKYVNFASNNYLGLTHHPKVLEAAREAIAANGFGSGAAPLVTGYTDHHAAAERMIAEWKGVEDSVLLPSGFQANLAAVGALAASARAGGRGIRFLLDKLVHASLIDAVRAADAPMRIYPHNGITKLRRLLQEAEPEELQVVVTESIFSMDGDAADLAALARLKREYPFVLVVDEAHATGVYGPVGSGYAAELGLRNEVDISIVTLSKALGGIGGAVCGSKRVCETVVNFGRAFLFSTSLSPSVAAAAVAAIGVMRDEPHRQTRVRELARRVRAALADGGLNTSVCDSPVIPVHIGDAEAALKAADQLYAQNMLVVAIRPPTVAPGGSRLRVTVSSEHSDAEIDSFISVLSTLPVHHAARGETSSSDD